MHGVEGDEWKAWLVRRCLRLLVSVVLLGFGLPLLVSGCGPKLTDPHEMWDRLIQEKNITTISSVGISRLGRKGYRLTIYAVNSSGDINGYNINASGKFTDYLDHDFNEWQGRVNLSPDQVDLDGLISRMPGEEDTGRGCNDIRSVKLTVVPTGKTASWTACSDDRYVEGSLEVDGKPVNDQVDPRDPAQIAGLIEVYNDIFGAGTLVFFNAALKGTSDVRASALPFADDPDCFLSFYSSGDHSFSPLENMKCSTHVSADVVAPFDLGKFSPSLVSDILTPLESLDVDISAIDTVIFTGTPEGNLKWNVSTIKVGQKVKYNDQMRGELAPIK